MGRFSEKGRGGISGRAGEGSYLPLHDASLACWMVWGGRLLVATDHGVVLVDPATGSVEKPNIAGRMVTCAAASPNGTVLTCGTSQGT